MPDYHIWFIALFVATGVACYLMFLYYKNKDKRKLMFSIAILVSNLFFLGASLGYVGLNVQNPSWIWVNITLLSSIPLMFAVFFAVNEDFLKIKNFDIIFYIFLIITTVCIVLFFITNQLVYQLTFFTDIIRQIIAVEVLIVSSYLFFKTRELVNLYFSFFIYCSILASISLNMELYLSAFAFVMGYIFIGLPFFKPQSRSDKKSSLSSYFSLEQKLKTFEERYKKLFNSIPDAITLLSEDGTILDLNHAMASNFGRSREEMIGKKMQDFLPEEVCNSHFEIGLKAFKTWNVQENEDKRGEYYFHNMFIPIKTEDNQKNLMVISRNITKEKQMEIEKEEKINDLRKTELATLNIMEDMQETVENLEKARREILDKNEELLMTNTELNVAREQLSDLNLNLEQKVNERTKEVEKLLKLKDEFIGQLGHDLKTPITPLNTLLPIIYERTEDKEVKELLQISIHNVNYMKNLVRKTLQLARLNSPVIRLDFEKINLLDEINHVLEKKSFDFKTHNIEVENLVSDDAIIDADKIRIEELLDNIISNSVKYSKDDGGKITIKTDETDDEIKLIIKDTGLGMDDKICEHIFDEFYKADESRHDFESTGLGLTICKKIVEHHKGRIWAESEGFGKGSTFIIAFNKNQQDLLKKK